MEYTEFGTTGVEVSKLGFGAMRLPMVESGGEEVVDYERAVEMMQYAFKQGVNYVDTAPHYCNGKSELAVGKALSGWRDEVYLSTKNPSENITGSAWRECLENSLEKLQTDYIDFYHLWGIDWESYESDISDEPLQEAFKAKEEGLINHLSFSFHDDAENLFKLIDTGHFETMLVQYNLLDRSNEAGISYAQENDVGVAVMGPIGGGRLASPSNELQEMMPESDSTVETALRFVMSNPDVDIVLSGMENKDMVEQNLKIAANPNPLSEAELEQVQKMLEENKKLADLYCTGCEYCLPCPEEVNIPKIFEWMNYHRVYDLTEFAKTKFNELGTEAAFEDGFGPEKCIECGACEEKCPQDIAIIDQLKETAAVLGE